MCDMKNIKNLATQHADHSVLDINLPKEVDETRYLIGIESLGHLATAEIDAELAEKTIGEVLNHIFKIDWKCEDDAVTIDRALVLSGSAYGNIVKMSVSDYKDPKKWETFSDAVPGDKISDYFIEFGENGEKIKYAGMRFG